MQKIYYLCSTNTRIIINKLKMNELHALSVHYTLVLYVLQYVLAHFGLFSAPYTHYTLYTALISPAIGVWASAFIFAKS
ncbi:MAG: hypothetical protein RIS47_610 [Bacteroidota bacterium]|jgi:hypothetical protein